MADKLTDVDTDSLPDDAETLKALVRQQHSELQRMAREQHSELLRLGRENQLKRAELEGLLAQYLAENQALREKLNVALARRFGVSSETIPESQLRLFDEAETLAAQGADEAGEQTEHSEVKGHTRVRRKGGRRELDPAIPRIEVLHELDEAQRRCPHDGAELVRIGEEVSEQLDIIPANVRVLRHVRGKYACKTCEKTVVTAPVPPQPIPKSQASPGTLAHVVVSKYTDGLPLYRQARIFERMGVEVDRGTLAAWMVRCAQLVSPLLNLMREELMSQTLIHGDETTVQVLNEPGRTAQSKSWMWVQVSSARSERPVVLFSYSPSRSAEIARELYEGFGGCLQVDDYSGYNALANLDGVIVAGCWAHAQRKFNEVLKAAGFNPKRQLKRGQSPPPPVRKAARAIGYMKRLFAIERRLKLEPDEERRRVRQLESRPVLDELRQWLDATLPVAPPKSALGRALAYLHQQWPRLIVYLEYGELEMTNNHAERAIRPFVVGRKAWLFSNTPVGAHASATLYSLLESAKAAGHEPYLYLRHVFTELPRATDVDGVEALLPWNLLPADVDFAR